ncbi:MAG: hypothetical protein L6Q78_10935 [Bacteroidia bacterium]|nr:hypothetical protein [Bacteroidia bacterium]
MALEEAIRQMVVAGNIGTYEQFIARYPATYDPAIFGRLNGIGSGATLGRAVNTLYSVNHNGDAVQGTVAAQPLCLVHSGINYVWLPGVADNNFTTPNAAANQITGDIDIKAYIDYINNSATQFIVSKTQVALTNHGYDWAINSSNNLLYQQSRGGVFNACTSSVGIGASYTGWVRMTRVSSTGLVTFFTSPDGLTWTQLGITFTLFTGILNNPSSNVVIGSYFNSNSVFRGVINRVTISNSINGSAVVDFNPSSYNRATSQTSWTSSTGEVWTLNTPTTNNALKAEIVDRTIVMGNGTSFGLHAASLNINQPAMSLYTAFKKYSNSVGEQVIAELGPGAVLNPGINIVINAFGGFESQNLFANVGRHNNNYSSSTLNLAMRTSGFNINTSPETIPYLLNNVSIDPFGSSAANDNTSAVNATGYNLLARNNALNSFANVMLTTHILAANADNLNQRTAMYNLIRSLNNNAF